MVMITKIDRDPQKCDRFKDCVVASASRNDTFFTLSLRILSDGSKTCKILAF
ncbi:hypothetical protein HYY75_02495 [bacterium]|nr:hypothetical protein [bacterium]